MSGKPASCTSENGEKKIFGDEPAVRPSLCISISEHILCWLPLQMFSYAVHRLEARDGSKVES